jgi:hypothetical protein
MDGYHTKLSELFDKVMEAAQIHCGSTLNVNTVSMKFVTIKSEDELYGKTVRFSRFIENMKDKFNGKYLNLYFDMTLDYLAVMIEDLK